MGWVIGTGGQPFQCKTSRYFSANGSHNHTSNYPHTLLFHNPFCSQERGGRVLSSVLPHFVCYLFTYKIDIFSVYI